MKTRGAYQGMLQILRFNCRFYAGTIGLLTAAFFLAAHLSAPWPMLLLTAALPALFWICSSLLVSHYIYDRSSLYNLSWLADNLSQRPGKWLNIHAGLDEISPLVADLFPSAEGRVLDIYDPGEMTERSIVVARQVSASKSESSAMSEASPWAALPLATGTFDAAILMFTAHELRRVASRVQFFRELSRVLRKGGEIALVEHVRDWPNFLAFGPGFLHFFSLRSWRQTALAAGFEVRTEFRLTPFVEVLMLRRTV
jgi:SAM-dependent methyltransferase